MELAVNETIIAPLTAKGEESTGNMKAAVVLREASTMALISAAVNGKGAVRKVAIANLSGLQSVDKFTSCDALDGAEWGDFLAALVGEFGVADFNRATMRGKHGAGSYMATVRSALVVKFNRAETVKAQETAQKKLSRAQDVAAHVTRLQTARLESESEAS
ncbi:MAG: hypothetical protein HXX17_07955 [Geobacteraceae bacterium]|nr:hypothetical protein [Geobacteraceae bacterium]